MKIPFAELVAGKIEAAFGPPTRLLSLSPLAGDASSRRYYRARIQGPAAPPSAIVMELAGSVLPLSSEELAIFEKPPEELPFLNLHRFFSRLGVRVPALYGAWAEEGVLLLEDLGDRSLWDTVQSLPAAEIATWYQKAIEQLLLIQIEGTRQRSEDCMAFRQRFDQRLYMWEFEHFMEYGFENAARTPISKTERELLMSAFGQIARRLDSQTPYLNHRDFHSWNLMVHQGEVAVIDFQDALLAPLQYDLASLLNDRHTDQIISPDLEASLIRYYVERFEALSGTRLRRDEFFEIYVLSALQRDFKVVGRFRYLQTVKGKPGYAGYIPATLRRLKRNLQRLPAMASLVPILASHFEEMR